MIAKRSTLPTDTIPLANALDDIQQIVLGPESHKAKMLAIITILSDPGLNSMLDRIIPERRER
jgi:type IV secretory pathway VirB2 component (pilin)